jgi:hypothetical protein
LWIQAAVGIVCAALVFYFGDSRLAASLLLGVANMTFLLVMLGWSIHLMLEKKSIAWTVSIIVIKYAVLLGSTYILAQASWFRAVGYGVGLSSFVVAALIFAVFDKEIGSEIGSF